MRVIPVPVLSLLVLWTASAPVQAQLTCTASAGVPPVIRSEGQTERIADVVLSCTGQSSSFTFDLAVSLNAKITSPPRGTDTDAVLLINDPAAGTLNPGVNMFRATRTSDNAVKFANMTMIPPPANGSTTLRITNLRADATSFALPGGVPVPVTGYVSVTPTNAFTLVNGQQTVAYVSPDYTSELRTPADGAFSPVVLTGAAMNTGLLSGNGSAASPQYLIKFRETFQSAFKPRSTGAAGDPVPAQNTPGAALNTETGFYDPGLTPTGEWNVTGLANSGTRMMARFSGVPAGYSLYVSATPWPIGSSAGASLARLILTDQYGAGPYDPVETSIAASVSGISVPVAAVPLANGSGTAVWEITSASAGAAATIESLSFAVFLATQGGTVIAPRSTVDALLAPVSTTGSVLVPRFVSGATAHQMVATAAVEGTPDLISNLALPFPQAAQGAVITGTASMKNQGQGPTLTSTLLRVQVYSDTTPVGNPFPCEVNVAIAAGATSAVCNWSLVAPWAPGNYTVRATADAAEAASELDETNNVTSVPFMVMACRWSVPNPLVVLPGGASTVHADIPVDTGYGCRTSIVQPNVAWLSAWEINGGTGVHIQALPNLGATRSATFTVAGTTVAVTQAAGSCTYSVSPLTASMASEGETKDFQVTTADGCPWAPEVLSGWQWLTAAGPAPLPSGSGQFSVTAAKNTGGQRTGSVGVVNQTVSVAQFGTLDTTSPFGSWDTPVQNTAGLAGAIAISGWALDDTAVKKVQIWRSPVTGEPAGLVYIGDATFVNNARPDVAALYPNLPFATRAGWGYMLLSNTLPGGGNGSYTFHVKAIDDAANITSLGARTLAFSNSAAVTPFGTIDSPAPGETISGSGFANRGWVLTPMPANIPTNGSTIFTWIDGVRLANSPPQYNRPRSDVAGLFPGYANTAGPGTLFTLDTTGIPNGVHTIAWSVKDSADHSQGIGSRYFEVSNSVTPTSEPKSTFRASVPSREGIWLRTGYDPDAALARVENVIDVPKAERIEVHLPGAVDAGCFVIGNECTALPAGSTLRDGIFYWQIGAAFAGEYQFRFSGLEEVSITVRVAGDLAE